MKTVILIGAQGRMGQAAITGLKKHNVITASRSGTGCDHKVDITSKPEFDTNRCKLLICLKWPP